MITDEYLAKFFESKEWKSYISNNIYSVADLQIVKAAFLAGVNLGFGAVMDSHIRNELSSVGVTDAY